jgi:hypothetical protein
VTDPAEFARQVETYLCQKNRGHLIRVVGPAFDLVRGWAATGVPLKVAFRGIDRCCERHERKAGRRRPVRLEFCEADVLDAFDDWRRAVGVAAAGAEETAEAPARKPALAAHIERAIARLAHARGVDAASTGLRQRIDEIVRELEDMAASAMGSRGEARAGLVNRLGELDAALVDSAIEELDAARAGDLHREAAEELAPFGARMPAEARQRAEESAFRRLAREAAHLPVIGYE